MNPCGGVVCWTHQLEPYVVDWSIHESSPCGDDVFPEQSQALALISEDVSFRMCAIGQSAGN